MIAPLTVAYHEAGHAIVAVVEGCRFTHATIVPGTLGSGVEYLGMVDGFTSDGPATVSLGGLVAEYLLAAHDHVVLSRQDPDVIGAARRSRAIAEDVQRTGEILIARWDAVDVVARFLLERSTVSYAEIALLAACRPGGVRRRWSRAEWTPLQACVESVM